MKRIVYICDLCKVEKVLDDLIPYSTDSKGIIKLIDVEAFEEHEIEKMDNHICFLCTDIIIEFRNKIATD